MAKYKVIEVYTPNDTDLDRRRCEAEFESESDDLCELAVQARISCYGRPVDAETVASIRQTLEANDVQEQIEDCTPSFFAFEVFGRNGDWELTVTKCS